MARDYDEVLSVKLCCAGVIVCDVIMVMSLMYHFIQTSYMDDDITNFRHYFTYSALCVISILLMYLVERGNRLCWIACVLLIIGGIIITVLEFKISAYVLVALIMMAIALLLLLMPPVCKKCRVPILMKVPWFES